MTGPDLHEDCDRCAALCCAAYPFEQGHGFGAGKAVDVPCPHLAGTRCTIHAARAEAGYSGCAVYTCHGAGPYVTQVMFGGTGWQDDPARLPAMTRALRDLTRVQEWRVVLDAARSLPLGPEQETRRAALADALLPQPEWTQGALDAFHAGPIPGQIRAFLASLRTVAGPISDPARDAPRPEELSDRRNAQRRPRWR